MKGNQRINVSQTVQVNTGSRLMCNN